MRKVSARKAYIIGIVGAIVTLAMVVAVFWFEDFLRSFQQYGYIGAFFISILGGATIIIPVPMLAVVFALGGVMKYPVLVGVAAGLGETVGALTIYMTGYGGGTPFYGSSHGKIQAAYSRLMGWMKRRGTLALFILSAIINPFFYPAALAAGALRFGMLRYCIVCWAGKTIKCISIAYAGYGLLGLLGLHF